MVESDFVLACSPEIVCFEFRYQGSFVLFSPHFVVLWYDRAGVGVDNKICELSELRREKHIFKAGQRLGRLSGESRDLSMELGDPVNILDHLVVSWLLYNAF